MGVSINGGTPNWLVYKGKSPLKWMIWGYPHLWKPPNMFPNKKCSKPPAFPDPSSSEDCTHQRHPSCWDPRAGKIESEKWSQKGSLEMLASSSHFDGWFMLMMKISIEIIEMDILKTNPMSVAAVGQEISETQWCANPAPFSRLKNGGRNEKAHP